MEAVRKLEQFNAEQIFATMPVAGGPPQKPPQCSKDRYQNAGKLLTRLTRRDV